MKLKNSAVHSCANPHPTQPHASPAPPSEPPHATSAPADKSPLSTPTGLACTTATSSQINLSGLLSTDNGPSATGVKGSNVYRNGVFLKQVAAPGTSTSDTGLRETTQYSYS